MAGSTGFSTVGPKTTSGIIAPPPPSPVAQSYNLYNTGVKQQAGDYDSIMNQYKLAAAKAASAPSVGSYTAIQPQTYDYQPTADYRASTANLQGLAATGGYSEADKGSIRARGISPIRAVYAGAQRDIDRNRVLSGGFSPNYGAVKAKMARELSDTIAGQVTNINAGLAQNIAQNRLNIAPTLASAVGQENSLRTGVGQSNTGIVNDASKFNAQMPLEYAKLNMSKDASALDAIRGQASLYGTTPALSALFGNQALSAAQLQALIDQEGRQNNLQVAGQIIRS